MKCMSELAVVCLLIKFITGFPLIYLMHSFLCIILGVVTSVEPRTTCESMPLCAHVCAIVSLFLWVYITCWVFVVRQWEPLVPVN